MATFLENYRETVNGIPITRISQNVDKAGEGYKWSNMFPTDDGRGLVEKAGYSKTTNPLVFRDANEGEKTGHQKVTLINKYGDPETIYLVVPEKEVVGYGNIVGWGDENDKNMAMTQMVGHEMVHPSGKGLGRSMAQGAAALASPLAIVGDLVFGNTIANNEAKQKLSKYTGEDKAVGLGGQGESEGQILGLVDSNGNTYSAKGAKDFLENLVRKGYMGIEDYALPEKEQEHNGPAYVPGDILLGLLGLRPNRGAVAYGFGSDEDNYDYNRFVNNIRTYGRADRGGQ